MAKLSNGWSDAQVRLKSELFMSFVWNRWLTCAGVVASVCNLHAQRAGILSYTTPCYVEFNQPSYVAQAGETNASITVVRTGEYREPVSVNYSARPSGAGADTPPAASGKLSIPAGVSFASFSVPLPPVPAGPLSFALALSDPSVNGVIARGKATLNVLGADPAPAPRLVVRPGGKGQLRISWSATGGGCVLEKTADPARAGWTQVKEAPAVESGSCSVTQSATGPQFFYRLRAQ